MQLPEPVHNYWMPPMESIKRSWPDWLADLVGTTDGPPGGRQEGSGGHSIDRRNRGWRDQGQRRAGATEAWNEGYTAGLANDRACPFTAETWSWASGWIKGEATRRQMQSQDNGYL